MSYRPTPKQALYLWRLITAETDEEREPKQSDALPRLSPKERKQLADSGLIELQKRTGKRGLYVVLTDKAWAWAATEVDIDLMKSNSSVGAKALEGLLHRLLPFLEQHDIPLAALFSSSTPGEPQPTELTDPEGDPVIVTTALDAPAPQQKNGASRALPDRIEAACLSLAGGVKQKRVRLNALRKQLSTVPRESLDRALLQLQDEGRLVLYRDDNSAALTDEDHEAALLVGNAPRHLVYLEA